MLEWTQIVVAVAGSVSAIAGATAAGAAWRSALNSSAAARDVKQALGLAIKPTLEVSPFNGTRMHGSTSESVYAAIIKNSSLWAAVDIEIEATLIDGRKLHSRLARAEPTEVKGKPREHTVDLGPMVENPKEGVGVTEVGKFERKNVLTIRYWDERRLLRWEHTFIERYVFSFDGRMGGFSVGPSRSERMLTESK